MNINLTPTREMFYAPINGVTVPCRVWKGTTDKGTPIEAYVLSIVPEGEHDLKDEVPEFMRPSRELFMIDLGKP